MFTPAQQGTDPLQHFTNLDMLDLHDNRISGSIDFSKCSFIKLQNLRILNLSGNQIEEVVISCSMKSLTELNLRGNKIREFEIKDGVTLESLTKLFLSNNQIKSFEKVPSLKQTMPVLLELTLENNPIEKDTSIA